MGAKRSFKTATNLESNIEQGAKDRKDQVPWPWWAAYCFGRMRSISDVCRSFNSRLSTTTVQAYLVGGSIHVQNSDNKLTELTNGFVQNLILMEGIIFCWLTFSIWHANPTQCSFTAKGCQLPRYRDPISWACFHKIFFWKPNYFLSKNKLAKLRRCVSWKADMLTNWQADNLTSWQIYQEFFIFFWWYWNNYRKNLKYRNRYR